jgi:hypothetical protein
MIIKTINKIVLLLICLNLFACVGSTGKFNTNPQLDLKNAKTEIKIQLPENYNNHDMVCRIIFIKDIEKATEFIAAVELDEKNSDTANSDIRKSNLDPYIDNNIDPNIQTEIENRLARLKNLNIRSYSTFVAENKNQLENSETVMDIRKSEDKKRVNHIIALQYNQSNDTVELSIKQDMILFSATVNYLVIRLNDDGSSKTIESGEVEGLAKRYTAYDFKWNKQKREYDKFEEKEEGYSSQQKDKQNQQAFGQASCRASLQLVNKLGNAFPIQGKISSWAGSDLKLNINAENGVHEGQIFILYTEYQNQDIAFALAKVTDIRKNFTELKVYKWSSSGFAKPIVKAIENDNSLVQLRKFYAVSAGLSPDFFKKEICLTLKE